jgi:AcrR family transcriptional regulator
MLMNNVRISRRQPEVAEKSSVSPRKKPIQCRSQMTLTALQKAFVQVLVERGYDKMTIREVAAVAGVGVGTMYDYVPNLRALAASTIHKNCVEYADILKSKAKETSGQPIGIVVNTLLTTLIELGFARPREWTALLLLERQVSSPDALRKIHEAFVDIWAEAFRASSTVIPTAKIIPVARMAHAISYGWYSHDLLFYNDAPLHSRSMEEIGYAIIGFVHSSPLQH